MYKHELADQFIREVYQQYPNIRHGSNTAASIALIRACKVIEELEGRLATGEGQAALSPATIRQDRAGASMTVGDTRAPDSLVSPQDDPVLSVAQGSEPVSLGQIQCPNCGLLTEIERSSLYCIRCGYREQR